MWKKIVTVILVLLAGGYIFADAWDLVPGFLTTAAEKDAPLPPPTSRYIGAAPEITPITGHLPNSACVNQQITKLATDPRNTGTTSVIIFDPDTGEVIGQRDPQRAAIPASNMKLLTAAAALTALGPQTRLSTTTLVDGNTLYLRGGGDVLLGAGENAETAIRGRAGLATLARETATQLRSSKIAVSHIAVDSSLFAEPTYHPDVIGTDREYIMELRPIAIDRGSGQTGFMPNPDVTAAQTFRDLLAAQGIPLDEPQRAITPPSARELAHVQSAPIRDLVDVMLVESDNSIAEVLGHLLAHHVGEPATFAGGAAAVRTILTGIGINMANVELSDASGLSISNRVTATAIADVLRQTWECDSCPLAAIPAGLPVAALDGTLWNRFDNSALRGILRAKTGTLIQAISLSGYLRNASDAPLGFVILIDNLQEGTAPDTRVLQDEFLDGIAACPAS
ncbi:D-alanyl-D-alanine carboxypeptidase/D-alanyl-D-alanine-endopeptidase [Trueperella sp. LYQ143]|uniref:D-alanyl-D-alanine carboxypeptidase/D-alanyl-D-alanine endopeptidase n=1 Tax=Trueperella sp. LYQ143 TaxID=3391059 RepID=UPI00398322C8